MASPEALRITVQRGTVDRFGFWPDMTPERSVLLHRSGHSLGKKVTLYNVYLDGAGPYTTDHPLILNYQSINGRTAVQIAVSVLAKLKGAWR